MNFIKKEAKEVKLLLHEIPTLIILFFILSIFLMNILANKSINLNTTYLALDCGIVVSWIVFLTMDVLTKHFGPKAATQISIFGTLVNLSLCLILFVAATIPGVWGESFVEGSENIINNALNNTIGGTWYVLLGSTIAFIVSAVINNFLNYLIGKCFKHNPNGKGAYVARTYISTSIAQFIDNLLFALLVSHIFFNWSIIACFTCALTGMAVELLVEVIFSPLGYKICSKWRLENLGQNYFDYIKENK